MTTLMAEIASKVLAEAELASVTQLDMHADKPADNGIDHPECATPKTVISSLETSVEFHIGHGNEFKEAGKEEEAKFEFSCAETMQELLILLRKGDEKHHKLASLAAFSAKNSIQNKIPSDVLKFLVPSVSGKKDLKERFMDRMVSKVKLDEGIEMLAEDVFGLIQNSVAVAQRRNPNDAKSEQAYRAAAHYMSLLVGFMQVDKSTNTEGEEELRSYVPVGSMYRNGVQTALDKFAQFIKRRGGELDFGRYDPVRITAHYQDFLLQGGEEQWNAVGQQLTDYFKQREASINQPEQEPAGNDTYEMRARAERERNGQ